jgi:hypothetical protein
MEICLSCKRGIARFDYVCLETHQYRAFYSSCISDFDSDCLFIGDLICSPWKLSRSSTCNEHDV